jgi:hypothetical protein
VTTDALKAPLLTATFDELVDWLEFSSFFSNDKTARVDELFRHFEMQYEAQGSDIAELDSAKDQFYDAIENEYIFRRDALGEAYPFELLNYGEEFGLKPKDQRKGASLYLLCLILSHVTNSSVLAKPPSDATVRDVRKKHWQVFSTLALAGHAVGPAISIGWPRAIKGSIISVVQRACNLSETGKARSAPASTASAGAKDGGVDVLAWSPAADRPPPVRFIFGQAASGHNWRGKPAKPDAESFLKNYYDEWPNCNTEYVTICPFRVTEDHLHQNSGSHGHILDRTRGPRRALEGMNLARTGTHVEEMDRINRLNLWVSRYRNSMAA